MTIKGLSRRQILVSMSLANFSKFMVLSYKHIANINRAFKNIKSDVIADFIQADHRGLTITTNKVMSTLDLNTIKKYIKNANVIDFNDIIAPRLPQSKSYLKILDIPYLIKNTNIFISSNIVKRILELTHIFNNIVLDLKPRVIKVSSKSDIAVIWTDIWNTQSSSKAKSLINRYFNIGNLITTV